MSSLVIDDLFKLGLAAPLAIRSLSTTHNVACVCHCGCACEDKLCKVLEKYVSHTSGMPAAKKVNS